MNLELARPSFLTLTLALLPLGLVACGGGGSDGGGTTTPGGTATVDLDTLSGMVRAGGGGPLANVTVRAGSASALTDAGGAFILTALGSLPVGDVLVEFDGSTATAPGPIPYPLLDVRVSLPAGTRDLVMPQVITLPDLNHPASANQSVMLEMDGTTSEAIDAQGGTLGDLALAGPAGTLVTLGGMVGAASVDINVTPVPSNEVPMPLPDGLVGNAFVTIQPGNAAFDPPDPAPPAAPVEGLDVALPNPLGLPVGTQLDIWSFDHDAAAWVNRSAETGQRGTVELVGAGPATRVVASGVITEGGWHTAPIPADPDCATRVAGRVVDDSGNGIAGASVVFATGQFATTGPDGSFTSDLVPAYDVAQFAMDGTCIPADVCLEVVLPPSAGGASSGKITIPAGDITTGGTTMADPVVFTLPTTGSVAGVVLGMAAAGERVLLTPSAGGAPIEVEPSGTGAFFATGLEAGNWVAAYTFLGEPAPTTAPFTIVAGEIAHVTLQMAKGGGDEDVTVLVLEDDDIDATPPVPSAGATVRLQGTDPGSSGGLVMLTGADGRAVFQNVSGPFTVTAQKDVFAQAVNRRFASSLVSIDPPTGTIGVLLSAFSPPPPPVLDATLEGTVANLPALGLGEILQLDVYESGLEGNGFQATSFINPITGDLFVQVPSGVPLDVVVTRSDSSAPSRTVATLLAPAAGQAPQGGSLTLDLDFADAVAWDQPVDLSFTGVPGGSNVSVDVLLEDVMAGIELDFDLYSGPLAMPLTLNLPDVTDPAFAAFRFRLDASTFNLATFGGQSCDRLLTTTPASLDLELIAAPLVTSPLNGVDYPLADLETLPVSFVIGSNGSLGPNGVNGLNLFYESGGPGSPPPGVDAVFWTVFVSAGTSSFTLPPTGLPMFGPGQEDIAFQVLKFRFDGPSLDYDAFFNEDLADNLFALLTMNAGECEGFAGGLIGTE